MSDRALGAQWLTGKPMNKCKSGNKMPSTFCGTCGEPALFACSRGKIVYYCAPACQARDWSTHKGACKTEEAGAKDGASSAAAATTASRAAEPASTDTNSYGLCAAECGKPAVLRCSGCLGAFYCGPECQKRVWKQHKEQCKKAAKAIASLGIEAIDDLDKKFASFKREAEAGDAKAQYCLGLCYDKGSGVAVDKAEAFKWYKRAAEAGDVIAQYSLGVCYTNGSVAVDKAEAVKWCKRAAEAGYAQAQFYLGASYALGSGVAVDKAEALKWFRRAAEAGYADALGAIQLL
jgi:hypothetical protein